jgi:hypothetical protein
MPEPLNDAEVQAKALAIARTFTPDVPVSDPELFAGRQEPLVRAVAAASQRQPVAIYGRPGVGKKSLRNMIAPSLGEEPAAPIVVADADSAEGLIAGGAAILLPPMTTVELNDAVDRNLRRLSMTIDDDAKALIAALSCGLPRYTHLLTQDAALDAVLRGRTAHIAPPNVKVAIRRAVDNAPAGFAAAWRQATRSPRVNLFQEVLLACALAPKHPLGWFRHDGVSQALKKITGKRYHIRQFTRHLQEFSETRGPILQRAGELYKYFYRFVNPLMESYVLVKATVDGLWNQRLME